MSDPRWIGAWWLGFVSLFGILIISGTLLLLFPKQMKDGKLKRDAAIKKGHLPSPDDKIQYTIKGFFMESIKIMLNKAFILATLALTAKALFAIGMTAFLEKILVVKFGVNSYKASMLIGFFLTFGMICKYCFINFYVLVNELRFMKKRLIHIF